MKATLFAVLFALLSSQSSAMPRFLSEDFINLINLNQSTWIAGENFPSRTPTELLHGLNGARLDEDFYNALEENVHNITAEEIPETFDAREYWSQCESLRSIRNQGSCGSCWAFGAVAAMSDRLCIATNATEKFQFSPEDLLSCCTDCGSGCAGGYSSRAWSYWVDNGIVSGGDFNTKEGCKPYTETAFHNTTTPECMNICHNSNYMTEYGQDKHYGATNYKIAQDVEQIQAEIMTHGPVQVSYAVYEDFYSYKSGVYQYTSGNKSGHHAVKLLGWGSENEVPYWLVANSWGVRWGDMGFFKILRGDNHCGIEQNVLGGLPKI